MESKEMAKLICETLSAKKAYDVIKIDVSEQTILADYFVIASGRRLFLAICYHLAAIFYAEYQRETDDSENHSASDLRIDRTSILVYDSCCHLIACQSLSDIRVL